MNTNRKPASAAATFWRKLLGVVLLFGTVGLVSCQASLAPFYPWIQ